MVVYLSRQHVNNQNKQAQNMTPVAGILNKIVLNKSRNPLVWFNVHSFSVFPPAVGDRKCSKLDRDPPK